MPQKLLVFGGNGFLGRRICQEAVTKGFQVVSLSKSGKAPSLGSPSDNHWMNEVQWERCDIFDPKTYYHQLQDRPDVVHSMGILMENENYKKNIRKPIGKIASKYLQSDILFGPNPLRRQDSKFNYEWMNKRSALILANSYSKILMESKGKNSQNLPSFAYISADKKFPFIPEGYISSKREAEIELFKYDDIFRPIIIRPGFMFDEIEDSGDAKSYIQTVLELLNCGNGIIFEKKFQFINDLIRPTVSTQQVGRCVIKNIIERYNTMNIIELEDIINM